MKNKQDAIPPNEAFDAFIKNAMFPLRELILKIHGSSSCIFSTAVTMETMKRIGIPSFPLVMRCVVYNAPLWDEMKKKGISHYSEMGPDGFKEMAERVNGCLIGIGLPDPDGEEMKELGGHYGGIWVGHLVAVAVAGGQMYMIDLSIDQANKPERGIVLGPIAVPVTAEELKTGFIIVESGSVGAALHYMPYLGETSFNNNDDPGIWEHKEGIVTQRTAETAVKYIRQAWEEDRRGGRVKRARDRWQPMFVVNDNQIDKLT